MSLHCSLNFKTRLLSRELTFERRTSTASELFSPMICLDAAKFVLLSFFALIGTIC